MRPQYKPQGSLPCHTPDPRTLTHTALRSLHQLSSYTPGGHQSLPDKHPCLFPPRRAWSPSWPPPHTPPCTLSHPAAPPPHSSAHQEPPHHLTESPTRILEQNQRTSP